MGDCVYCGRPAGLLRKRHPACEAMYARGWSAMVAAARAAASGDADLEALETQLGELANSNLVALVRVQEAMIEGWERAVDAFLDDGQLDEADEAHLLSYSTRFALSQALLDRHGAYSKLVKGAVLRDVMHGIVPARVRITGVLPFNLQKSETLVWLFDNADYYEDRARRHYVGGYQGVSIRIARGLYYRVGGFKGNPVETIETVRIGRGLMGVTTRHVYFSCPDASFRIRHDKVVSIEPFSDGVRLQRDAQTARPQLFVTGDGWFTYNLLMNIANL